jgi:hypothetical protein
MKKHHELSSDGEDSRRKTPWHIVRVVEASETGPARKIPRNYIHVTGMHPGATRGATAVAFESILEADFLISADLDPEVRAFITQPVSITWDDGRRTRRYTPDLLMHFQPHLGRKSWLCEIKTRAELRRKWSQSKQRFRVATRYAREKGYVFKIITDREIRGQFQTNAAFLLTFRRSHRDPATVERIVNALSTVPSACATTLMTRLFPSPDEREAAFATLWSMVATGRVKTDLHVPLVFARLSLHGEPPESAGYLTHVFSSCTSRKGKHARRAKARHRAIKKGYRTWQ